MTVGPYSVVLADCPWSYDDPGNAGKRGAVHKYPVMTLDAIKDLPVKDITSKDCVLFLWVTMPHLQVGLDVLKAWGFTYKTCAFTWVKRNKVSPSWFWGMGRWTRSNAELCLLGVKGHPKRLDAGVHSVVDAPIGRHSAKPPEVHERIVRLLGDLPRIELFAREARPGWDCWGYDAPGGIVWP